MHEENERIYEVNGRSYTSMQIHELIFHHWHTEQNENDRANNQNDNEIIAENDINALLDIIPPDELKKQINLFDNIFRNDTNDVKWFYNMLDILHVRQINTYYPAILKRAFKTHLSIKNKTFRSIFYPGFIIEWIKEYAEYYAFDKNFAILFFQMSQSDNVDYFDFFFRVFQQQEVEYDIDSFDDMDEQIEAFVDYTKYIADMETGDPFDIRGFCKSIFYALFVMKDIDDARLIDLFNDQINKLIKYFKLLGKYSDKKDRIDYLLSEVKTLIQNMV
ncbi:hypothetical protein M9Y10_000768 [Tritrichomonas musculus]|uniref:Uncharacterized protein n=1 Tax=Tritrichomonas musculus TaxID=1915356 RepID=A0ABR2L545_9EUKA